MKILIRSSSQRSNSMSLEVSKYLVKHKVVEEKSITTSILDISDFPALLHHYEGNHNEKIIQNKKEVLDQLYSSDAFIFVVPEWGGMIPPGLVNLFLLTANGSANGMPLGHKPGFIIGISASGGGHNPIPLIKGYTAKNSHITWISLHTIINNVEDFLAKEWNPTLNNRYSQIQSRLQVGIKALKIYAKSLKNVRNELVELSKVHPFGQ